MILAELSFEPVGDGESKRNAVARVVEIIDASGLNYQVGPMSTCVEGEWDEISTIVARSLEALAENHPRISATVRLDVRTNDTTSIEHSVESLADALRGRSVKVTATRES